jgi:hypothetical protein
MPGLLRGIARTAVIAGTATAVSNNVSRRQANRWAEQEAEQQPIPSQPPPAAAPAAASPADADPVLLLTQLADLHAKGLVTDEEFAAQKQRILG